MDKDENIADLYVNLISSGSIPRAITRKELILESEQDEQIQQVIGKLRQGKKIDQEPYKRVSSELSVTTDGLLLRGNRVVIPKSLRDSIIKIAHSGHQGLVRTKRLIRNNVWFPNIDTEVEAMMKCCLKCQANVDTTRLEPLRMTELPNHPWDELCIDFYGPLKDGKYLLVLIDEYSRYPIVKKLTTTSCRAVIPILKEIFSSFGIPDKIKSDNGPPFNSYEFKIFAEQQGFKHARITPLWPRSNGVCERFMRNLSKVLKNSSIGDDKFDDELLRFLGSYRSTPHSSTQFSPKQLLFKSVSNTTPLPKRLKTDIKDKTHDKVRSNDQKAKMKMKMDADDRNRSRESSLKVDDLVLVKQLAKSKSTTVFESNVYVVVCINGSMITAKRLSDGRTVTRNSSFFKKYHSIESNSKRKPKVAQRSAGSGSAPWVDGSSQNISSEDEQSHEFEPEGDADQQGSGESGRNANQDESEGNSQDHSNSNEQLSSSNGSADSQATQNASGNVGDASDGSNGGNNNETGENNEANYSSNENTVIEVSSDDEGESKKEGESRETKEVVGNGEEAVCGDNVVNREMENDDTDPTVRPRRNVKDIQRFGDPVPSDQRKRKVQLSLDKNMTFSSFYS